jgi:hypothetical protein
MGCVLQLFWFASKCFHQIDIDGMAYVGIARHLRQGELHASIDAFRSPLISWLIAVASFASPDYLHIGKLINIAAFLLTVALLYVLTNKLWRSNLAAALAILIFSLGRGLTAAAVEMITPDFLFGALTLIYFIVLLCCFRQDRLQDWFFLGSVHGLAFLAKAFALPWLAVCTLIALGLSITPIDSFSIKPWRTRLGRLALAALIPLLFAAGWAAVLHSKYGVFTSGTQFKVNLLQWTLRAYAEHPDATYSMLRDTSTNVDEYGVIDPMPPASWPWSYPIRLKKALPKIILAEARNIPRVLKEMTIVATLGGLLAFIAMLAILTRRRLQYPVEWRFAIVVAAGALILLFAYSMLVFDERYLFPLIPLVLAVAARFLLCDRNFGHEGWRRVSIVLVVLGSVASLIYPSSPFRLLTRDFQASCYDAGQHLRAHSGSNVVSIGSGPFPGHGVGWEAGYKASFFGQRRIIAAMDFLPTYAQLSDLTLDLRKAAPDAILVWGRPEDTKYSGLIAHLQAQYPNSTSGKILDPILGEVGAVLFLHAQ